MIFSNPLPGLLNYQNKNTGPNPYQQNAAAILQQIQAQQAQAAAMANSAQQQSNQSGNSIPQFIQGMGNLIKNFNQKQQPGTPLAWQNAPAPVGMQPVPIEPQQTRYTVNDVGNMESSSMPSPTLAELLPKLSAAAREAYPDNPTMQQVAMSQAILESGLNGKPSQLATRHNNYFGIKASRSFPGTGGTVDMPTQEYIGGSPTTMTQGFSSNNSMDDSFRQHANLLYGSSRYQPVIQSRRPEDAFLALQSSGYATDPNYASKLRSIYGRYVAPIYAS